MAYDIGPRIGIEGEAEYRAQMNNIITQTKTLHAEMKTMKSAWDSDTSAKQKAAQQTKMLKDQIALQEQKLAQANNMLDKATAKYGENSNQALRWRQAVANARTELNNLNNELRNTPNQLQALGQDMQATGDKIQNVGKAVTSVGKTMTTHVTAPIVAMGAAAVKVTADFDSSMSKVAAVSGATGSELEQLRAKAREMGAQTKFSASEAAEAMNYMAMAGWKTGDMLSGVEGIMDLAAASGEDLATTSDIVTDALTAFGKSAQDSGRLADIMAAASSNANTNVAMMGETFQYAAPVAGALGASMEDTAVAVGLMANAGVKASNAGTALRTGLTNLAKPTKQMKSYMDKYGIALVENNDGSVNLRETMVSLRKKMGDMSETEQAAAASAIFGKNAMAGWLAVVNGSDKDFEKLTEAVDKSDGTAKRMAETMQDNLAGQVTILKSQVEELGISFGEQLIPYVSKAVEKVQDIVNWFSQLDESEKDQIIKMAALAAAAGPVVTTAGNLITAGGKIYGTVGKVIEVVGGLTAAAEGAGAGVGILGAAMTALPVVGVAAGVGLAVGAVLALNKAVGGGKDGVSQLNAEMSETINSAEGARKALETEVGGIEKMNAKHDDSIAKTEAAARLAEKYADELTDLAGKTNKTTAEQAKMRALVGKLNAIYPELGLAIDDTTGELNMSTAALKENIKQLKEQAKAAAYNKILEEEMDKLVEIEKKVIEAEDKKAEVMGKAGEAANKQAEIQAALKAEQDELAAAQENYNAVLADSTATQDEVVAASTRLENAQNAVNDTVVNINGVMVESASAMDQYATAQQNASEEAGKLDASITSANEESTALTETMTRTQERLDKYAASLGLTSEASDTATEASDTFGTAIEGAADSADSAGNALEDTANKISEAWDKTYEQTKESVMGQKGLFDELEEAEKTSVEEMAKNLHKHVESYQNWNNNAKTLMESERYATDENFQAMVNSIVSAGTEMSPELQAIVDAFQSGDADLETLLQDYGTMSQLSTDIATATANATTAADYGLDTMNQAISTDMSTAQQTTNTGSQGIANAVISGQPALQQNIGTIAGTYDDLYTSIAARTGRLEPLATNDVNGLATGLNSGSGAIGKSVDNITKEAGKLPKNITAQKAASQKSGSDIVKATASSMQGQQSSFGNTAKTTGAEAKQLGTAITAQKAAASSAARTLGTGVATALNSTKSGVGSAARAVGTETKQTATGANAQRSAAQTAGKGVGTALKTGVSSARSTVSSAGREVGKAAGDGVRSGADSAKGTARSAGTGLGGALAEGIKSKKGSARSAGSSVAHAGRDGINSVSTSSARSWGQHLGENLASGIRAKIPSIRAAAQAAAKAAATPLKHSTPKEGPLRHDDVWGMHLAQNFADAMHKGVPVVRAQAAQLAQAASVDTYVDPLDVSGRGALGSTIRQSVDLSNMPNIDPEAIYNAVRAGAEGQSITLQIGERELGRVLRDMGVQFA